MIKIDTYLEFRKGILFVRISGVIDKYTYKKYYDDVILTIKDFFLKMVLDMLY